MNETTVKGLLQQAMKGEEPPVSPHLVGGAVRAARTARRRRVAGAIVAVAAIAPGLAFGVPAIAHALAPGAAGQHGYGLNPAAGSVPSHAKKYARVRTAPKAASLRFAFVRPKQLSEASEVNPVPITNQSVGQLLLDDLPSAARPSQIEASANANPAAGQQVAEAWFNEVTTAVGSGDVQADMLVAGSKAEDFGCPGGAASFESSHDVCRVYALSGGVKVAEDYSADATFDGQTGHGLMVSIFRPNVAEFWVTEDDSAMAARSPVTKGIPLTLAQMLKIVLDSRWQFTISQSFVDQASGLHVVPPDTSGS